MADFYIGIDGGATKCHARIEDKQGQLIGHGFGGPANIRISVTQAWQSISQAIHAALQNQAINMADKSHRFYLGAGLAGFEIEKAREEFLKTEHQFHSIYLTSDAHVACLGAHQGLDGAIIVIGTGVVGYQIFKQKTLKIGGWGFPHSDEGGGAWLGLEVVRLTLQWQDNLIESSPLLKNILNHFGSLLALVAWANSANSTMFAELAPLVLTALENHDPYAKLLMQRAAKIIEKMGQALTSNAKEKKLPCALMGGIAPFLQPWLSADFAAGLSAPSTGADVGALHWLRQNIKD